MNLQLRRDFFGEHATLGKLFVNGVFECYTLEDKTREEKIPRETAIPSGTYQVTITWSPHFGRRLPLLNNVPGFEGVRIHPGNTPADTEGCILVGTARGNNVVTDSRVAFNDLFATLDDADKAGEHLWLTIWEGNVA